MRLYRISKCKYIDDLSGTGAALYGGRWNNKGVYMLYTAGTAALALLETIVHMSGIPTEGFCLMEIDVPGNSILELNEKQLPKGWNTYPAPASLKKSGDNFIKKGEHLILKIPSAILSEEYNFLINPSHPDFKKIRIIKKKNFSLDPRLLH